MSGNVLSRRPLWWAAVMIGGSLLWPACAMEQPVVVPPDPESSSPLATNAPPHSASFASDPLTSERPPLGPGTPPPDSTFPPPDAAMPPLQARGHQELLERIRSQGRLPVIVRLKIGTAPPGAAVDDSETQRQAMIATTQQQVIERLLRATGTSRDRLAIKTFSLTPALGLQVNQRELRELLTYPEVSDIVEDAAVPPLDR